MSIRIQQQPLVRFQSLVEAGAADRLCAPQVYVTLRLVHELQDQVPLRKLQFRLKGRGLCWQRRALLTEEANFVRQDLHLHWGRGEDRIVGSLNYHNPVSQRLQAFDLQLRLLL